MFNLIVNNSVIFTGANQSDCINYLISIKDSLRDGQVVVISEIKRTIVLNLVIS